MENKNMKKKRRMSTTELAMMGLLVTLILLLAYTPLGAIYIGPIGITLVCLPVIIGTLLLGLKPGLLLGFIFGAVQFSKTFFFPSPLLAPLLFSPAHVYDPLLYIILMIVPRMLVPVTTYLVAKIPIKQMSIRYGLASVLGSFTNTVFFLSMLYLMFMPSLCINYGTNAGGIATMLFGIASTNGVLEAIVAVVCVPIVFALRKTVKGLPDPSKKKKDAAKTAEVPAPAAAPGPAETVPAPAAETAEEAEAEAQAE